MKSQFKTLGKRGTLSLAVILAFSFVFSTAYAAELKPYKFGAVLCMSGAGSWYGLVMSRGIKLASDEINAAGGVAGYKFVPIIEDHKTLVEAGLNGARKLISIDKVVYIQGSFGGIVSSQQPLCAENKVVLVNGGGTSTDLVNRPYLHNNRLLGDANAEAGLKYVWDDLGRRKMASMYYEQASGITIDKYAKELWTKWGGTVTISDMHNQNWTDFSASVAKVKGTNPDFVAVWSGGKATGFIVRELRRQGIKATILVNELTKDAHEIAGEAMEGAIFPVDYFDPDMDYPMTKKFVKHYREEYGTKDEISYFTANYYDLTYMLKTLIERVVAKNGDPYKGELLENAIWENPRIDSTYGPMVLKKDGTVDKARFVMHVKGGKIVLLKKFSG